MFWTNKNRVLEKFLQLHSHLDQTLVKEYFESHLSRRYSKIILNSSTLEEFENNFFDKIKKSSNWCKLAKYMDIGGKLASHVVYLINHLDTNIIKNEKCFCLEEKINKL